MYTISSFIAYVLQLFAVALRSFCPPLLPPRFLGAQRKRNELSYNRIINSSYQACACMFINGVRRTIVSTASACALLSQCVFTDPPPPAELQRRASVACTWPAGHCRSSSRTDCSAAGPDTGAGTLAGQCTACTSDSWRSAERRSAWDPSSGSPPNWRQQTQLVH